MARKAPASIIGVEAKPKRKRATVRVSALVSKSAENPANPISAIYDDGALFGGNWSSTSGVEITRDAALSYSPFYRGVTLVSRDVAKTPMLVYRRTEASNKERAVEHPAYYLLRRKWNRYTTAFYAKQCLVGHAITNGNGYAYIFRDGPDPTEIALLNPDVTWPVKEDGQLLYVTNIGGRMFRLLPENVIHLRGWGFDGLVGYGIVYQARHSLGLGIATRDFGSRYFKNSARPSTVIEYPKVMDKAIVDKLKDQWNQMYRGIDNAHKTAVLENGAKLVVLPVNARDSQLTELAQFSIRDMSNFLGVPPHKLGDNSRTAYNSLEQENQSYLDDALDGWFCNFEEECWDKLLTEEQKRNDTHVIEFLREALMRVDLKSQAEYNSKALAGMPWMTRNEVRGKMNLNRDPEGDKFIIPANLAGNPQLAQSNKAEDAGEESDGQDAEDNKRRLVEAQRQILRDALQRMVTRLCGQARKHSRTLVRFGEWVEGVADENREVVMDALGPCVAALSLAAGSRATADDAATLLFGRITEKCRYLPVDAAGDDFPAAVDRAANEMARDLPVEILVRLEAL
jgi:HK97 family phage portal protein